MLFRSGVSTEEAQQLVDNLAERRHPLVWKSGDLRRVLDPSMTLKDQIMILLSSCAGRVKVDGLFAWTGYDKRGYFNRLIHQLPSSRLIELHEATGEVEILPPGTHYVSARLEGRGWSEQAL